MSFFRFSEIELDFPPLFAATFLSPLFAVALLAASGNNSVVRSGLKLSTISGSWPALLLPDGTDARQTAARALTDIDQVEHLNE